MPDVFTPAKRSEVMSRIRSRGNARTEMRMVALFRTQRITGWRRHLRLKVPSKANCTATTTGTAKQKRPTLPQPPAPLLIHPDFVFPTRKVVVFVDGCFWHGCPRCYVRPKQNRKFWDAKREGNQARDKKQSRALRAAGWKVIRLWEHELAKKREPLLLAKLQRVLTSA